MTMLFAIIAAAAAPETHAVHVHGVAKYRCYAGYDGKKVTDERTNAVCDNKDSKRIIDLVATIKMIDEPDPEDSQELFGSCEQVTEFAGRKFTVALTLTKADAKEKARKPYRLTLFAADDEPLSRRTTASAEFKSPTEMSTLGASVSSMGKKEEISFEVSVEPAKP